MTIADPSAPAASAVIARAMATIAAGQHLGAVEAEAVFREVIGGGVATADISAVLLGLREKGETVDELAGAVRALRASMVRVGHPRPDQLVDTCGTGGGTVTTINVSTAAAFVAAGAGVPIAKHGNRSFTSRSGSADVLEALGVSIDVDADRAGQLLAAHGIVFLFAPIFHPAMHHVGPARRELRVPTIMNLVGPLANPAGVTRQVVGVADHARGPLMAAALASLGSVHAMVVHADLGMDELSPVGLSSVWEVRQGVLEARRLDPVDFGLATPTLDGLEGGTPEENAARLLALFDDPDRAAPALRAAVLLNAAAAICVSDESATLADAVDRARRALHGGAARARLERLRAAANRG